jgi:cobalt-zinc-cadmium resistance protein CzcA
MLIARNLGTYLIIFLYYLSPLFAQQQKMSFNDMWAIALDQNIQIKNAELLIEKSGKMGKTAWDFGSLDFDFTRGQQNSELVDNMYTFKQGLGAPFTISATRKYYKSEQAFLNNSASLINKEIKKQLRSNYYDWLYEYQLISILDSSILIYQKSADFASLQYETGESNLLSKVVLSSEAQRLIIRRDLHLVNLNTIQNEIQTILNTDSIYIPEETELNKLLLVLPVDSTLYSLDSIPEVMVQRSHWDAMDRYYKLEKSKISPSLSAGYYNQEIDQITGYQGWRVGLSFPLLFMPQKARSQAAYIELSRAENQYLYQKMKVEREIESLLAKYEQLQKSIRYYEDQRLNSADLIVQNSSMLYTSGSIGYIEFVQNLTTARQIMEDYIQLIDEHNQLVIDLYYYLDI